MGWSCISSLVIFVNYLLDIGHWSCSSSFHGQPSKDFFTQCLSFSLGFSFHIFSSLSVKEYNYKASCFQYHNCSYVVKWCVEVIINQRKRNSIVGFGQGTVLRTFYGLQKYSTNLYRPIGIKFLFWGVSKAIV
jgi:hypothetical protein